MDIESHTEIESNGIKDRRDVHTGLNTGLNFKTESKITNLN